MTTLQVNAHKSELFASRMVDMLNAGALSLMVSIGHRTGLFDVMATLPPSSSGQIADAAGLSERYVREWLGALTVAGVVEHHAALGAFHLPAEHAAYLTRDASPDNLAALAQFMPMLGSVEDRIVDCFRDGGGVPYSEFKRFQDVMAEDSAQTVVSALIDEILPLAPGITARLDDGIDVLDIGCGQARAMNLLARVFPDSRIAGYDISEEGIAAARHEAERHGCVNTRFEVHDAKLIDEVEQYDLITAFDAIHDQARPDAVLTNIYRALRPGGVFLMQDIRACSHVHGNMKHPIGVLLYTISCLHCMTVSLADGGMGLGAMWGEELALKMLGEAGFRNVRVERLEHDIQNNYYIATK